MKIMLFAGLSWRCSVSHTCSCRFPAPRRRGAKAGSDIGLRSTHRSVCVANHQRTADRRRDRADGCGSTYATAPEVKPRHLQGLLGSEADGDAEMRPAPNAELWTRTAFVRCVSDYLLQRSVG
jgi:hypothetical protein